MINPLIIALFLKSVVAAVRDNMGRKADAAFLNRKETELRVLEYRKQGMSYEAIAKAVDMSKAGVSKMLKRIEGELNKTTIAAADEARLWQRAQCRYVVDSMTDRVSKGDPKAAMALLKAVELDARLTRTLDTAPPAARTTNVNIIWPGSSQQSLPNGDVITMELARHE
jgi:predicted transcriptional regulator